MWKLFQGALKRCLKPNLANCYLLNHRTLATFKSSYVPNILFLQGEVCQLIIILDFYTFSFWYRAFPLKFTFFFFFEVKNQI